MWLFLWFTIGFITNIYYLIDKGDEYAHMLDSGEIKPIHLFIGVALTFILWPLSIFNNEFKNKQ